MTEQNVKITCRSYEPTDLNFILKSWLRSYRRSKGNSCSDALFYPAQQQLILKILQRPSTRCTIACEQGNTDFIFGFIVTEALATLNPTEPVVMHYVFTKLSYRRIGVADYLLRQAGWAPDRTLQSTHWTMFCRELPKYYKLVYNDYFLMGFEDTRFIQYEDTLGKNHISSAGECVSEGTSEAASSGSDASVFERTS